MDLQEFRTYLYAWWSVGVAPEESNKRLTGLRRAMIRICELPAVDGYPRSDKPLGYLPERRALWINTNHEALGVPSRTFYRGRPVAYKLKEIFESYTTNGALDLSIIGGSDRRNLATIAKAPVTTLPYAGRAAVGQGDAYAWLAIVDDEKWPDEEALAQRLLGREGQANAYRDGGLAPWLREALGSRSGAEFVAASLTDRFAADVANALVREADEFDHVVGLFLENVRTPKEALVALQRVLPACDLARPRTLAVMTTSTPYTILEEALFTLLARVRAHASSRIIVVDEQGLEVVLSREPWIWSKHDRERSFAVATGADDEHLRKLFLTHDARQLILPGEARWIVHSAVRDAQITPGANVLVSGGRGTGRSVALYQLLRRSMAQSVAVFVREELGPEDRILARDVITDLLRREREVVIAVDDAAGQDAAVVHASVRRLLHDVSRGADDSACERLRVVVTCHTLDAARFIAAYEREFGSSFFATTIDLDTPRLVFLASVAKRAVRRYHVICFPSELRELIRVRPTVADLVAFFSERRGSEESMRDLDFFEEAPRFAPDPEADYRRREHLQAHREQQAILGIIDALAAPSAVTLVRDVFVKMGEGTLAAFEHALEILRTNAWVDLDGDVVVSRWRMRATAVSGRFRARVRAALPSSVFPPPTVTYKHMLLPAATEAPVSVSAASVEEALALVETTSVTEEWTPESAASVAELLITSGGRPALAIEAFCTHVHRDNPVRWEDAVVRLLHALSVANMPSDGVWSWVASGTGPHRFTGVLLHLKRAAYQEGRQWVTPVLDDLAVHEITPSEAALVRGIRDVLAREIPPATEIMFGQPIYEKMQWEKPLPRNS